MSEWKKIRLGDVIESVSKTFKFKEEKVYFLNTSDTLEGKVLNHNLFDPKDLPGQAKKTFQKRDILYSEIRPENKRFAFIDFDSSKYVASTKLMVLRPKEDCQILPEFLFQFLTSQETIAYLQIQAESRSGTFPQIRFDEISHLEINLPPLPTQKAIAEILSSLDDKIELNNEINQNLEALAQALFKQWFVDFKFPNENGEPYKSSGGEMIDSELGEIPKGWEIESLSKIASLEKSSVKPFEKPNEDFFHYSLPEFDSGKIPSIEKGEAILSSKYKVISNSILFSKLNPRIPRVWPIINCKLNSVCSTEFQVIKPEKEKYFSFINSLLNSEEYIKSIQTKVTGTSSSHQRVNPKDIINYLMPLPTKSTIELFHSSTFYLFEKVFEHRSENQSLKNLRDTLLPKLISGELEVNELLLEPTF